MTTSGQLVGCELLTRFHCQDLPVLNSKYFIMAMDNERKRELLTRQLQAIELRASWFRDHRLFCTVNVDTLQARWIGPYISIHFLSLNPLLVRRRRYSRGERYPSA
ncbi:hypothetical protein ACMWKN_24595, partial [Enterobacter sp. 01-M-05-SI-ECC]